jgi:hypothetical protein
MDGMKDKDKLEAAFNLYRSKIFASSFLPKDTVFIMHESLANSFKQECFKVPVPQPPEEKPEDRFRITGLSYGSYAKSTRRKRTFKNQLKCIPHILREAFKVGWGPGKLKEHWKYENVIVPPMSGLTLSMIGV